MRQNLDEAKGTEYTSFLPVETGAPIANEREGDLEVVCSKASLP